MLIISNDYNSGMNFFRNVNLLLTARWPKIKTVEDLSKAAFMAPYLDHKHSLRWVVDTANFNS
jgi:hypothetical protein